MQIACVGKPSSGKSTFFSAATLVDVEIANRPFTTIKPNQGTGYVTTKCVHEEKGKPCQPMNSKCENGIRLIPIQMLDVAGLIEDSWKGRGLGNSFLNDLMQAQALIHVLDVSGTTDAEGNTVTAGSYNPVNDVEFLEREVAYWIKQILEKNWGKISKSISISGEIVSGLATQLSGLGIKERDIKKVLSEIELKSKKPSEWDEEEMLQFSSAIREKSKPMVIAANKCDMQSAAENLDKLKSEFSEKRIFPTSAESELSLRRADKAGIIKYIPGGKEFEILKECEEKQKKALEFIQKNVLDVFGSTGVQQVINKTAFDLLDLVVVYPVQDQSKWVSGKGHYLPDAFLVKKGTTPKELAGIIHTDFANRYLGAINCRTNQKISESYEIQNNDVIKILLRN
ncbi:MAG: redox-regulated ATPase YchF [Candidatus Diapherotrites archaeon]